MEFANSPQPSLSTPATSISSSDEQVPVVKFTTIKELFQVIDKTRSDVLIASDISPKDVDEIHSARDKAGRGFRLSYISPLTEKMLITIPSRPHEAAHENIHKFIMFRIYGMGLDDRWSTEGATRYKSSEIQGSGSEPDKAGKPIPERPEDGWPTLVIEAGYSQSMASLRATMEWWFRASNHEVKIVLLIKVNQIQQSLVIERWEEVHPTARLGATTTRSVSPLRPDCRQEITITKDTSSNPATYQVNSTDLVLPFRLLFLREPGPQEGDIVVTTAELQRCAAKVWYRRGQA
ncbi:uncharacterized protein C8A04DRAFT_38796 [Dichotomopilus funicola]|uniref:Uncharacterized protein n=1 Tax=Dichotomopilus funicola TaxID=1934379 RepID=A0AAN6ZJT2_9PEZI|nr:hypothetical protein C8A04DRAFT_38796 [Dichotomopilus funicola]